MLRDGDPKPSACRGARTAAPRFGNLASVTYGGAAARGAGTGRLLGRVLAARGIGGAAAQAFLHPGWGELHSPWRMARKETAERMHDDV